MSRAPTLVAASLAAITGCKPPALYTCTARVSDTVNTVLLIDVDAPEGADAAVTARVVFGEDAAADRQTPEQVLPTDGTTTFQLLGIGPLTDIGWHVLVADEPVCSGTDSNKNLPSDLAEFTLTASAPAQQSDTNYVLFALGGAKAGLAMADRDGTIVWYHLPPAAPTLWVQAYWRDTHALFNSFDPAHVLDIGTITRLDAERNEVDKRRTVEGHHTFAPLEPEVYAYLRRDRRQWYNPVMQVEQSVVGDAIVEQAADGSERVVFDAWDWLEVRVTPEFYGRFYADARDWTHANSIHWRRDDDTFLMAMSNLGTVVHIDRATGDPLRWFGIDGEDPYGYSEGSRHMQLPHDPTWTGDDTFMVFMTDNTLGRSGAIEYRIDEVNHVLDEVWSYGFSSGEPIHRAFFLGQASRQTNGNTVVKWAATGRMVEVTPDKQIVWDLRLSLGGTFQEADFIDDIYEVNP